MRGLLFHCLTGWTLANVVDSVAAVKRKKIVKEAREIFLEMVQRGKEKKQQFDSNENGW